MHLRRLAAACFAGSLLLGGSALAQPAEEGAEAPVEADEGAEVPVEEAPASSPPSAGTGTQDGEEAPGGEGAPAQGAAGEGPAAQGESPPEASASGQGEAANASSPPEMDGQTYAVRLRDLQQRIDQLKEQIRRSHTRLSLLSDTILSGGGSGSRSSISFENKLSDQFKVTRLLVVLDGTVQYNKTDRGGALGEQDSIPIFSGSIPPGDHTVQVLTNLQGHGYGVFSYLRGYKFEVRSSHSFTTVAGKTTRLRILAYEKGGVTTPLEERPAVRFIEKVVAGLVDQSGQAAD